LIILKTKEKKEKFLEKQLKENQKQASILKAENEEKFVNLSAERFVLETHYHKQINCLVKRIAII